jgi:hypothetical protein
MATTVRWNKGFFKSRYELFLNGILAGGLKNKSWTNASEADLNGKEYLFKTSGFFRQTTQIIDLLTNTQTGLISYNAWGSRAKIEFADRVVEFKFTNTWNTKWTLSDKNGVLINYRGSDSKGEIETETQDEMLILAGLFIKNHYSQSAAMIFVVLIPIFAAASH